MENVMTVRDLVRCYGGSIVIEIEHILDHTKPPSSVLCECKEKEDIPEKFLDCRVVVFLARKDSDAPIGAGIEIIIDDKSVIQ